MYFCNFQLFNPFSPPPSPQLVHLPFSRCLLFVYLLSCLGGQLSLIQGLLAWAWFESYWLEHGKIHSDYITKENDSPSSSNHEPPVASSWGRGRISRVPLPSPMERSQPPPPPPGYAGLVNIAMSSPVQWPYQVQKTVFQAPDILQLWAFFPLPSPTLPWALGRVVQMSHYYWTLNHHLFLALQLIMLPCINCGPLQTEASLTSPRAALIYAWMF